MEEQVRRTSNPRPMFPHAHDFPELLSWWGTDPDNPEDNDSWGMLMEDEIVPLESSWVAYIPAGILHMPVRGTGNKKTSRPVCHWTSGPGVYIREKDEKSEKAEKMMKDLPELMKKKPEELKYSNYFVMGGQKEPERPDYMPRTNPKYTRHMAYIDNTIISDAEFGCDTRWLLPGEKSKEGQLLMKAHTLPHGTSIVLNAMNYEDITDLCAEAELWIGGEKHIINKSFGAYIPPDVEQGPLIIRNITRQIFFMVSHPVGEGIKKYRGG